MQETNRPFNVQNVADMMAQHGIKKPQVERALLALAQQGDVVLKVCSDHRTIGMTLHPRHQEFGKAKIFFLPQDKLTTLTKEVRGKWHHGDQPSTHTAGA